MDIEKQFQSVEKVSKIRSDIVLILDQAQELLDLVTADGPNPAGREIALVKTKLQEARMWSGMILSHFDTGFQASDMPGKPETKSTIK